MAAPLGLPHVVPPWRRLFAGPAAPAPDGASDRRRIAGPAPRSRVPARLKDQRDEIEASGLFEVLDVTHYDWETVYDAEGYIDLLNTFSGHIAMQDWQRDRLYGEIRSRLARRADGFSHRHWGSVLHVARRRTGRPLALSFMDGEREHSSVARTIKISSMRDVLSRIPAMGAHASAVDRSRKT